jgi:hypothetical protein
MAALVIYRHRTNIGRLLKGKENKIGRGGKAPVADSNSAADGEEQ